MRLRICLAIIIFFASCVCVVAQGSIKGSAASDKLLEKSLTQAGDAFKANKPEDAAKILERAIAQNPNADTKTRGFAEVILGFCYEKQGEKERAAQIYKEVIEKYPGTQNERRAQFRLDEMLGRRHPVETNHPNPKTIETAYKSANNAATAAKAATSLIWFFAKPNTINRSRAVSDDYIKRFGYVKDAQVVLFTLAMAYENIRKFDDALQVMNTLFSHIPEAKRNPLYLSQLGYYLNLTGRSKQALVAFNQAMALHPNKFVVTKTLLGMGVSYHAQNKLKEASKSLDGAEKMAKETGDTGHLDMIKRVHSSVKAMENAEHPVDNEEKQTGNGMITYITLFFLLIVSIVIAFRFIRMWRANAG